MIRQTLIVGATLSLIGCTASTSIQPIGGASKKEATELAAYAATTKYPAETSPADLHVAVLLKGDTFRLVNFTDQPIRNANIWINGVFVRKVDVITPQGSVSLPKSTFYDKAGHSLADVSSATFRVTIEANGTLSTTLGPVAE